jgi:hypothetical protein
VVSAEQAARMAADAARAAVDAYRSELQDRAPAAPQQQPQQQIPDAFSGLDDKEIVEVGQARALARNYEQRFENFGAGLQQLYAGSVARDEQMSRMVHKDVWDRHGKELKAEIEKRKQYKVITAEDYDEAVDLVRGRHIKEYAEPLVQQAIQNAPPADVGVAGTAIGEGTGPMPELPEHWKPHLVSGWGSVEGGIRAIQDMLRKRREEYGDTTTFEQYMEMMTRDELVRDDKGWKSFDLTTGVKKEQK